MKIKQLIGDGILVSAYKEDDNSKIIKPDSADIQHSWYQLQMVGEDVSEYSEGDIVLINPQVVKRGSVVEIEGEDLILLSETNIQAVGSDG